MCNNQLGIGKVEIRNINWRSGDIFQRHCVDKIFIIYQSLSSAVRREALQQKMFRKLFFKIYTVERKSFDVASIILYRPFSCKRYIGHNK